MNKGGVVKAGLGILVLASLFASNARATGIEGWVTTVPAENYYEKTLCENVAGGSRLSFSYHNSDGSETRPTEPSLTPGRNCTDQLRREIELAKQYGRPVEVEPLYK